jgi:hypothetical protein
MLALCLTTLVLAQDPGTAEKTPPPAAADAVLVKDLTYKEAKAALASFKASFGGKSPTTLAQRMEAVEELAKGRHDSFVKPLQDLVVRDKAISVRRAAAKALGDQPTKKARPAILRLIENPTVKREPLLLADLIGSLDRAGYDSKRDWKKIDGLFEREYGEEYVPLQKALLALITGKKEKQAVDLLLRNLGEPIPVDVDAASNPPAEYWERRWKAWQVWRQDVKHALLVITGQRFSTAKEARAWLRKNGRKIGIK